MKKLFKTFGIAVFAVLIKTLTVVIFMSALLGIFIGGCYLLYLAIDLMVCGFSTSLAFLHLLGGTSVLVLIVPVYLKIWNVLEEKIS